MSDTVAEIVSEIKVLVLRLASGEASDHDKLSDAEYKAIAEEVYSLSEYLDSIAESFEMASYPELTALLAECCRQLTGSLPPKVQP